MSLSEDEGLLNSDSEGMTEEKSLQKDNSITAIISDESEISSNDNAEHEENQSMTKGAKAFSDKDNSWIRLKKDTKDGEEEEEESEMEEEEKVWVSERGVMSRTTLNWRQRRKKRIACLLRRRPRRIWRRI